MQDAGIVRAVDLPAVRRGAGIKKVKMRHRRVVALHLSGYENSAIDRLVGRGQGYAASVLREPKVREILHRAYEEFDLSLKALVPKAIITLSRNMDCKDPAVEVRAATEALKVNGKYDEPQKKELTAEEVIEELWNRYEADGSHTQRKTVRRRILTNVGDVHNA